jgi:hypothetical protein
MEPSKKDWKLFREKLPGWQESYMEKLVMEYKEFVSEDIPASTKFWELEKKIKLGKKQPGVILERNKRNMVIYIIRLLNDKVITMNDLLDFSDELRENIMFLQNRI